MPRPQKPRRICCYPDYWSFAPDLDKANETITMSLDEFETVRSIDYQRKTQTAQELSKRNTVFYIGHCTGIPAFELMKQIMGNQLIALHSGDSIGETS